MIELARRQRRPKRRLHFLALGRPRRRRRRRLVLLDRAHALVVTLVHGDLQRGAAVVATHIPLSACLQ